MPKFNLLFIKNLLFIFLIILSCNTFSASFDCAKATTPIEKLICSNNSLFTKDEALNKTYKTALSKTNNQKELTKRQLNWLKNTRNQCNTVECLEYVYQERIDNFKYSALADDVKIAIKAVQTEMKKSDGAFYVTEAGCKDRKGEYLEGEYLYKSQSLRVDSNINAVLLTSGVCGASANIINATLVLVKNNKPKIVKDFADGMGFLGEMRSISGRTIVFYGDKWKSDDTNCCPSQKAELRFNVDTGQQSLKVVK